MHSPPENWYIAKASSEGSASLYFHPCDNHQTLFVPNKFKAPTAIMSSPIKKLELGALEFLELDSIASSIAQAREMPLGYVLVGLPYPV